MRENFVRFAFAMNFLFIEPTTSSLQLLFEKQFVKVHYDILLLNFWA